MLDTMFFGISQGRSCLGGNTEASGGTIAHRWWGDGVGEIEGLLAALLTVLYSPVSE